VLRCAGAGAGSVFARGVGVFERAAAAAGGGGDSPPPPSSFVREELVGRFVGGYGERCFNPLGWSGGVTKAMGEEGADGEEEEAAEGGGGSSMRLDLEVDGMAFDDPEDDGRGLVSAAWGTGHDGSAIEIVGVEFVEVSFFSFLSVVVRY
jgi:hypothetical protein